MSPVLGTLFSCHKIKFHNLFEHRWAYLGRNYPVADTAQKVEITKMSTTDVFQWLQEVCTMKLLQSQIVLGGPDTLTNPCFVKKPKLCKCKIITKCLTAHNAYRARGSVDVWDDQHLTPSSIGYCAT